MVHTPGGIHAATGTRSLGANMLFAVGGMGAFQAAQLGTIILLAKFAPAVVLGQVQFSLAVATPILMFFSLELRGALVADAAGEFTFGAYRALRRGLTGVAAAILLGVSIWEYFRSGALSFALIFAGMCASKVVLSLAEINWGLFQKRERLDLVARSAVMRGVAMIVLFAAAILTYHVLARQGLVTGDVWGYAAAAATAILMYTAASVIVLFAFDDRRTAREADYDPHWTWSSLLRLAQHTIPLGLVLLILHACNSIPLLAIEAQPDGKAALGYFAALTTLPMGANLLVFQGANAAANRLSAFYQSDMSSFLRLAGKLFVLTLLVGAVMILVIWLLGPWLLRFFFRTEHVQFADEFLLIALAQGITLFTNIFGVLTTQMRLYWLQVPAQVIVLITTLAAAFTLIVGSEDVVHGGALTILWRASVHALLYTGCVLVGILARKRVLRARRSAFEAAQPPAEAGQEW